MLGLFCWKTEGVSHCTKKHISQVLEYHEKFKNTKKTSTFQIKERPYFLSLESSKQELFHTKKTWYFMVKKISSYINFLNQREDRISHLRKFQNKNFSVFRKLGIPCWRKYHLTSTFWIKRRQYFPSTKSSKQELPLNMNFSFRANSCFCNNNFFAFIETYVSFNHSSLL